MYMNNFSQFQSNFTYIDSLPPIPTKPIANGLVNAIGPNNFDRFNLFEQTSKGQYTDYNEALTGNVERSILSDAFFSAANIQIVNNAIRAEVHKATGRIIGNQDENTLKTIMRSVFLQWSANLNHHIKEQIMALNHKVLEQSVSGIVGEIDGYLKYKRDISTLVTPIDRPAFISNKGDRTLELKSWF